MTFVCTVGEVLNNELNITFRAQHVFDTVSKIKLGFNL